MPGGIKQQYDNFDINKNEFDEEIFKNKTVLVYKYLIEKIAELKFTFGEFINEKEIFRWSPYLIYLYAFLILFTFGIGIGFLRNNLKKSTSDKVVADKPLVAIDKTKNVSEKDNILEVKNQPNKLNSLNNSIKVEEIRKVSPSLEEIKKLINSWLISKSNYLSGKSEINLSKIVSDGLIDRTIEERQNDISKGIYKEINSQILKFDLESQTSSRIVVVAELNYLERVMRNSGDFINETSLNPLKVKYILGFSNKSWKLVDFVSGL